MDKSGNLRDVRLKKSKRIGIGHHHGCNLAALICNDALQIFKIDSAVSQ